MSKHRRPAAQCPRCWTGAHHHRADQFAGVEHRDEKADRRTRGWGGRAQTPATGYNLAVKTFYQRLCELGNAKKVALIACMQKLLTTLSPIRKPRTPWRTEQPQHA